MEAVLELVAGSYEQVTFGYRVNTNEKVDWRLSSAFAIICYMCWSLGHHAILSDLG